MLDHDFLQRFNAACDGHTVLKSMPRAERVMMLARECCISPDIVATYFEGERPRATAMRKVATYLDCGEVWLSMGMPSHASARR